MAPAHVARVSVVVADAFPRIGRTPPTILLVEDEDGVRNLVRTALERDGYAVVATADAADALTRFRTDPGRFDLVLSDILMPGLTGLELAAAIRGLHPAVRVLFMSGFVGHPLPPGSELLEKPFTIDQLLAAVARACPPRHDH